MISRYSQNDFKVDFQSLPQSAAGNALRPEPEMPDVTAGLRAALDALNAQWEAQLAQVKDVDKDKLTRPNVVALLTVIADHLAPALYQQHGDIDGHPVVSDHDAVAVLRRFIDALEDIKVRSGNVLFKSPEGTGNRVPVAARKARKALVELVLAHQKVAGPMTRKAAEIDIAKMLNDRGVKLPNGKGERDVEPTQAAIKSIIEHPATWR